MDVKWRFGATLVIWILATIMSIVALTNASAGMLEDWVVAVPLGVALIATLAVWESSKSESSSKSSEQASSSAKKGDSTAYNMALLMEMMDDDEREEFKSQLKRRILSGETVTDESIVADIEKRKRG